MTVETEIHEQPSGVWPDDILDALHAQYEAEVELAISVLPSGFHIPSPDEADALLRVKRDFAFAIFGALRVQNIDQNEAWHLAVDAGDWLVNKHVEIYYTHEAGHA